MPRVSRNGRQHRGVLYSCGKKIASAERRPRGFGGRIVSNQRNARRDICGMKQKMCCGFVLSGQCVGRETMVKYNHNQVFPLFLLSLLCTGCLPGLCCCTACASPSADGAALFKHIRMEKQPEAFEMNASGCGISGKTDDYCMVMSSSPALTVLPSRMRTLSTTPFIRETTLVSIFIASMTAIT